ncbi:hypothetical protein GCM10022221_27390 [Actinocorallia aurea]
MGRAFFWANAGLAFVLEVAALVLLARWGFTRDGGWALRVLLGVGAPVVAAVVWGLFAAPRAVYRIPVPGVLAVKAAVFLSAALAVDALHGATAAVVFTAVVVANTAIVTVQR